MGLQNRFVVFGKLGNQIFGNLAIILEIEDLHIKDNPVLLEVDYRVKVAYKLGRELVVVEHTFKNEHADPKIEINFVNIVAFIFGNIRENYQICGF